VYLPEDVFGLWMSRPEPEVRSAGLFLSVYSTAITRHMTGGTFASLQRNLIHLHTDTDANFRREVHGYTQKLFDRLRASTATLAKGTTKAGSLAQAGYSSHSDLPVTYHWLPSTHSKTYYMKPLHSLCGMSASSNGNYARPHPIKGA
jgi:hypothetical protein